MKRITFVLLSSLLLLLALPAGSALAAPINPFDRILPGEDYLLEDGETEQGDVVIFGGSAEIEEGAILEGNLVVLGGDVEIAGDVEGDVVVFGGDGDIEETAYIEGDCVLVGGDVNIEEGAIVDGEIVTSPKDGRWPFFGKWVDEDRDRDEGELPTLPSLPSLPSPPSPPPLPSLPSLPSSPQIAHRHGSSFAGRVGNAFLSAIGIGILALLITLFWPRHTDQVRRVVVRQPATSGLVGFLTLLAAGLLTPIVLIASLLVFIIGICLLGLPLVALLWLPIVAAGLFGWAAIGRLVGQWIGGRLNLQGMTPALEAGLGAFALSLALGFIQAIWFIGIAGGLLQFGIFCVGLGAVILTRFGRQDYQSGQPILPQRPPKPAAPVTPVPPAAPADKEPAESSFETPLLESEGPFPEK